MGMPVGPLRVHKSNVDAFELKNRRIGDY